MKSKIACIVYLDSYKGSVAAIEARLGSLGYEVHSFEVTNERAAAVKVGDLASLPQELRECLNAAEICVLLLGEDSETLGPIGALGSDLGCRVVTIGGDPEDLPGDLDDIIDGHLPDCADSKADEVLGGSPERIKVDGEPAEERKLKRVKCQ